MTNQNDFKKIVDYQKKSLNMLMDSLGLKTEDPQDIATEQEIEAELERQHEQGLEEQEGLRSDVFESMDIIQDQSFRFGPDNNYNNN